MSAEPAKGGALGPELAIVIVGHNDSEYLGLCLDSLFDRPPATPHQVAVVDNASSDDTVEMIARRWPDVLVLENPANVGFARAVNRGIRSTSGEMVLLLNPDTQPNGQAIDALVEGLRDTPAAAAAGPRIVDGDGRPEISWWAHPGPFTEWRLRRLKDAYQRGTRQAEHRVRELTGRRRDVGWVTGACLLLRREAANAAGLMDEAYFLYFDDADLCAALRAAGGRILFLPEAEIVHLRGRTVRRDPKTSARHYRASQLHFYRKHHRYWYPLLWLMLLVRGQLPPRTILSSEA